MADLRREKNWLSCLLSSYKIHNISTSLSKLSTLTCKNKKRNSDYNYCLCNLCGIVHIVDSPAFRKSFEILQYMQFKILVKNSQATLYLTNIFWKLKILYRIVKRFQTFLLIWGKYTYMYNNCWAINHLRYWCYTVHVVYVPLTAVLLMLIYTYTCTLYQNEQNVLPKHMHILEKHFALKYECTFSKGSIP